MYCVIRCIVQGNQARVKNEDLRHPSCTVVKTQICITCPQCVNTPGIFILLLSLDFKYANIFMEDTENLSINVLFLILHNTHAVFLCICTTYLLSV